MLKYLNSMVTFSEFPDEISLCINITCCPNRCPGCHSPELWNDIGNDLDKDTLLQLIKKNEGITCIGFMGGDQDSKEINILAKEVKKKYPTLKVGWYSGKQEIAPDINLEYFDYIKIGPYIQEKGGLSSRTTNQRMIWYHHSSEIGSATAADITDKFWKNNDL